MKKITFAIIALFLVSGIFLAALWMRKDAVTTVQNPEMTVSSQAADAKEDSVRGADVDWISDGTTPIIEPEGSTFVLKSIQTKQGEAVMQNLPLSLGYNGTLHVTVNHTKIFDSPEAAGVSWDDLTMDADSVSKNFKDPCFVWIDLTLENVDAANISAVQYQFSASMFDLRSKEDFAVPNNTNPDYYSLADSQVSGRFYFSAHADDEKDYYAFMLEPGQTMPVQLGFFAEREFAQGQELYLKLGSIRNNLCGIALNPVTDQ